MKKPTKQTAIKILELLEHGLTKGQGSPEPGKMCVEAAVCYAMGLPHNDNPPCVSPAVRSFKIVLNDSDWSSNAARAKGMRQIAIAQLGSESINEAMFVKELVRLTIQKIVPIALRAAAKLHPEQKHRDSLEEAAVVCERDQNESAARSAESAARSARSARSAARSARSARSAAESAAWSAESAAESAESARSAESAARSARSARSAARSAESARSAAESAAWSAAWSAESAAKDEVFTIMAECGVEALKLCKSPGCEWLDLCE